MDYKKYAKTFDGHLLHFVGVDFEGSPLYGSAGGYRYVSMCEIENAMEENKKAEAEGWTPVIRRY